MESDVEKLCLFCFEEKGGTSVCPHCGHSEDEPLPNIQQLPRGTVLDGKYLIGQSLGQGGFGITYLAYDLNLKKKRAIKEYFPEGLVIRKDCLVTAVTAQKKDFFDRGVEAFYREAQAVAQFDDHPNIIQIYSFFRDNNTSYFVMEYVEGVSLSGYLEQHGGRISYKEAERLLLPIAAALCELHKAGLLHRDVKPDNIYITRKGQSKLLDFGSARYESGLQSQSAVAIVTPGYAPPEQYSTIAAKGTYTDVYALAATFYRVLTGIVPPDAADRMLDDKLQKPSSLCKDLSPQVEEAILKAMAVNKDERTQTIEIFVDMLKNHPNPENANHANLSVPVVEDVNQSRDEKAQSLKKASTQNNETKNSQSVHKEADPLELSVWDKSQSKTPNNGKKEKTKRISCLTVLIVLFVIYIIANIIDNVSKGNKITSEIELTQGMITVDSTAGSFEKENNDGLSDRNLTETAALSQQDEKAEIKISEGATPTSNISTNDYVTFPDKVLFYIKPSTESDVVRSSITGKRYKVLEVRENWIEIEHSGPGYAWAQKKDAKIVEKDQ